jgi:Animal haem peroxidase
MKTSAGDNLPIGPDGLFMAGDVRAAENPDLTALQTLFVREHNYQVITYNEYLPHLLGDTIAPYQGYDPNVDPRITEEFAGAAYRFGHSIVSAELGQIDELGRETGSQDLQNAFFEPASQFIAAGDIDSLLRGLAGEASNALDPHIVEDLRNFLFDPPDGIDLAAINIERGRDLGLGTLNDTREALGLNPYTSFDQLTTDPELATNLAAVYETVDQVDLWVGGLSEDHAAGSMVGETFQTIIGNQFEALRDGDRLYFENQGFDTKTLSMIENTTLSDIIVRNTDVEHLQSDAFVAYERHTGDVAAEDPDAPQLVIGTKGSLTLQGGPQDDVLVAASGNQTLTGLEGADQFTITRGAHATITDFTPGTDTLQFEGIGSASQNHLHIRGDHHGNTIFQVADEHVVLLGVLPSELQHYDAWA